MSATISITCGNCKKPLSVPVGLKGKKIRCKGCGQTIVVQETRTDDDEWSAVTTGYGVTDNVDRIRCPYCAGELPDENTVVCLNCGYNLRTRQRLENLVLEPLTFLDYVLWYLPVAACVLAAIFAIMFIVMIWLGRPRFGDALFWIQDWTWAKVYATVALLFVSFFSLRFVFKRVVLHPQPPQREKRIKKEA